MTRSFQLSIAVASLLVAATAAAQPTDASTTAPGEPPPSTSPPPAAEKPQGRGDFDAGGKVRFPSGPDETRMQYGSFNWVALDLYGRYFILDQLTVTGSIPLAPLKPEFEGATEDAQPKLFGGFTVRPELALGKSLGVGVTLGYLRERAVLLSEKDFPAYLGDLTFAAAVGPWVKLKGLGLDFALQPSLVYQRAGEMGEAVEGLQLPVAASLALGELLRVSLEAGVFTGDDFALAAADGGRIALGAAVDIKISKLIVHLGAGAASLLVDDESEYYPSIGDSIYFDLNVKFAK